MKITIHQNKIVFIGKGPEIAKQLKIYATQYERVVDWIDGKRRNVS